MAKKLLITGVSGFIASHCTLELLKNGYEVKGTVRNINRAEKIRQVLKKHTSKADEIEFVQAELTDASSLEEAVKGCSGVLHIASPVPIIQPRNAEDIIVPAREVLGWTPRSSEESIRSGAQSLIDLGIL
jgi:nucleoside-diphosphate-sugar epimerase